LRVELEIKYDGDADAAYIYLTADRERRAARTVSVVDPFFALDFDEDGRAIGIEVLDASVRLPSELLDRDNARD
jgi:uncharacterized protein YuzE